MRLIFTLFLCLFSNLAQAQTNVKADTTVYFFGNLELRNGLHVLTDSDSLVLPIQNFVKSIAAFHATNKPLLLKLSADQIGKKDMKLKNPNESKMIYFYSTKRERDMALNQLKSTSKNSLFYLREFKFIKDLGLKTPGNPVIK